MKELQAWIRDRIQTELDTFSYVRAPIVAKLAVEHFAKDPEFVESFFMQAGYRHIYQTTIDILSNSRAGVEVLTESQIDENGEVKEDKVRKSVFGRWIERSGDKFFPIMTMTGHQLVEAANQRGVFNRTQVVREVLDLRLAAGLPNLDMMVGDVFTVDQVAELEAKITQEVEKNWPKIAK